MKNSKTKNSSRNAVKKQTLIRKNAKKKLKKLSKVILRKGQKIKNDDKVTLINNETTDIHLNKLRQNSKKTFPKSPQTKDISIIGTDIESKGITMLNVIDKFKEKKLHKKNDNILLKKINNKVKIAEDRKNLMKEQLLKSNGKQSLAMKKKSKFYAKLRHTLEETKIKKPIMSLRSKMLEKLKAARFRFLNEQIYKTNSKETQTIFNTDPDAYKAYHDGYRQQVKSWPLNPVTVIIKSIKKMPNWYKIADMGCGDAQIAKCVEQQVYSFDLVAVDESVTACDMAHIPLEIDSVDVVVFCLSLMGTNLNDYFLEANRILKNGGTMKIAEVESRFENVDDFIKNIQKFGFRNVWKDVSHNLFYFLDFTKVHNIKNKNKLPSLSLLPCLYKKR